MEEVISLNLRAKFKKVLESTKCQEMIRKELLK